ncbi:YxlC family protein [Neobacillus terrae]|uniref:YxlC family protein n=1 Tax=Neobacillus terrae TaxID=3034837 RepID=UPI00140A44D5|nr:YxlC family protein [Neobacillus terrae]NHM31785.1 YxlC family protein [Neobacillus terrae]
MKKQKIVAIENEHLNKADSRTIDEIIQALDKIDHIPVYSPDLHWFEQMILNEKQQYQKKLIRDLSLFFIIAAFILTGIIVSLSHKPIVFIVLQAAGIIFTASYTGLRFSRKVNDI